MLSETRGCTRGANPPTETSPGCRAFITQSEEEVCNDEPRNCVANARWQGVVNFVLGAWLLISPRVLGFSDAGVIATSAWLFGIIIAGLALTAIFAYES